MELLGMVIFMQKCRNPGKKSVQKFMEISITNKLHTFTFCTKLNFAFNSVFAHSFELSLYHYQTRKGSKTTGHVHAKHSRNFVTHKNTGYSIFTMNFRIRPLS